MCLFISLFFRLFLHSFHDVFNIVLTVIPAACVLLGLPTGSVPQCTNGSRSRVPHTTLSSVTASIFRWKECKWYLVYFLFGFPLCLMYLCFVLFLFFEDFLFVSFVWVCFCFSNK